MVKINGVKVQTEGRKPWADAPSEPIPANAENAMESTLDGIPRRKSSSACTVPIQIAAGVVRVSQGKR